MPGKVENSFYKAQEMSSTTGRSYRPEASKSKLLYYVESDSKELRAKNTILMG